MAAVALVLTRFASQDPDSTVYAGISARLAGLPVRSWIAPEWWGLWGFEGPFREHPVGIFLLPALLGIVGVPALQAGYIVGACFSIAALLLIRRVAALVVGAHESAAIQWAALILPIAFVYRIRATQEYPVLVLMLLALYATHQARKSAVWILLLVFAACATALVKGIFVVFVPAVCVLWLLCIHDGRRGDLRAWLGLGLAVAAVALLALSYEDLYRRTTGDSFLDFYLAHRLGENLGVNRANPAIVTSKLYNLVWYTARLLWFAVPGTLALIVAVVRPRKVDKVRGREVGGLYFAMGVAIVYVAAMSLGQNKADRFIFPAYFFVGVTGALVAMRRWEGVDRFAQRLARLPPHALPLAWLLLYLVALPFELNVPYVKFWTE